MEDFVKYIVKNLVDLPESVQAAVELADKDIHIEVRVARDDLGKVIGRNGKTIQALRTITGTAAARLGYRARLEVVE